MLTLIRTVKLFNAVEKEFNTYVTKVRQSAARGRAHGTRFGIALALTDPMEFALYSLGFWYGAKLVRDGDVEVGDILIALCVHTSFLELPSAFCMFCDGRGERRGVGPIGAHLTILCWMTLLCIDVVHSQ